jgi:lysophospholipid acyltransferase (LPLAT)-like uncharacterized protein
MLFPVVMIIRVWLMSLRIHIPPETLQAYRAEKPGRMVLFWHNRLLISAELQRRHNKQTRINGLVSASKDGAWLSAFFRMMGVGAIRGSSSWRGGQALVELSRALAAGEDVAITPDGPRGPCYDMKTGPALLVQKTGCSLFLMGVRYYNARRLGSWDGFYLPMPFSRVDLTMELIRPDAEIARLPVEEFSEQLRQRMLNQTDDAGFVWVRKSRKKKQTSNSQ